MVRIRNHIEQVVASFIVVALVAAGFAIFLAGPVKRSASPWEYVLGDAVARSSVRLLVVAVSIYGVVSVPALVLRGRWIRSVGPSGVSVESAAASEELAETAVAIADLARQMKASRTLPKEKADG